ncbi:hypothetical protein [Streptomyces violarus]|uniref:hypothetical protein n=1 Tax=Streptomyces violarus TaxID=67380 RepID=UPI0021BF4910|nr:hypothetical protein [Streptomyces violarus]MCT9139029.1 hypothetical protein [Streptomyces violarus]
MRAQRVIDYLSAPVTAVGVVLVVHGVLADGTTEYRAGLALLLVGLAGIVDTRNRRATERLIAHQAEVARLATAERWHYAEMGWKAAKFDSLDEQTEQHAGDGQVVYLPDARAASEAQRNGSVS